MPEPGSKAYDDRKSRIRHDLDDQGVTDDTAAERADDAMDEANDPEGRKHVSGRVSGGGIRSGEPWPERPPPAG